MKRFFALLLCSTLAFTSCGEDLDDNLVLKTEAETTFNFTHNWDETEVTSASFDSIQYLNQNGDSLSIEKLRYLISDITFSREGEEDIVLDIYNLVDVTNSTNLSFSPETKIPLGQYTNVSFTYGFDDEDNIENAYPDLNSENWEVPNIQMFGNIGGYHYMQLEGRFINNADEETTYAYHNIRAADGMATPITTQDTSIQVNLGAITITNDITFQVKMNIAEWFQNTYQWDLNTWNSSLMGNFDAQLRMNENGQNVFSLGTVTQ
ncbi:MbnP family protein [Lacinutrix mariniflava]|uniref:MbnP family protein n=1 Tax=Lacinutrix mariniflava TaxID=342955 RepID=UPI0006E36A3B|nr:MbnP family protein [Lacinutrix mariniflava]